MIGSLMSRMSTAQNMDVKQLQQAVQDGTLPAYVGIPLIQDKMKQQQMSQAGKPQPQQPPIADQILGAAKQQEERGIDAAQSNLPEMTAAEGGIMSYADGGDVDSEDYEYQLQDDQDMSDLSLAQQAGENIENEGIVSKQPSFVNKTPNVEQGIKGPSTESLISHILKKESGGKDFDKEGKPLTSSSGAKFAMQVLPSTARDPGFGIKPAKNETPEEYNRIGKELATALLDKYKNPAHAAAAYNWGSGNVDKWLAQGADPARLPKETKGYIQGMNLAQGGIASYAEGGIASIAHFAKGDLVNYGVNDPSTWEDTTEKDATNFGVTSNPNSWEGSGELPNFGITNTNWENKAELSTYQQLMNGPATLNPSADKTTPPEQAITPSAWDQYLSGLAESRNQLKNQKDEDKYMSLLTAGLGMVKAAGTVKPGEVHSGLSDVSTGALEGVAYASNAAKQRSAQENALNKEAGTALYRNYLTNAAGANQAANLDIKNRQLSETEREHQMLDRNRQESAFQNWQKMITAPYDKKIATAITQEDKDKLEQEKSDSLYNHPVFRSQWKQLYPDLPLPEATPTGAGWDIKPKG